MESRPVVEMERFRRQEPSAGLDPSFRGVEAATSPSGPSRAPAAEAPHSPDEGGTIKSLFPAPILEHDDLDAPSMFTAEAMLSLARQRKGLTASTLPDICVLDPDGDLERRLFLRGELREEASWGCFHTQLRLWEGRDERFGIIGRAVGASFSVLLAEQLFASGCRFLISVSSAGQVVDLGPPPYFVVIDRALRDEGASYHYLPPARFVDADRRLLDRVIPALARTGAPLHVGPSWTTDAPFRETEAKVARRRDEGMLIVEMEAAALYAFAAAQRRDVLCLAQVTNRLTCVPGDFNKGIADGADQALDLIIAAAGAWRAAPAESPTASVLGRF